MMSGSVVMAKLAALILAAKVAEALQIKDAVLQFYSCRREMKLLTGGYGHGFHNFCSSKIVAFFR
jgi:hypothetical protein